MTAPDPSGPDWHRRLPDSLPAGSRVEGSDVIVLPPEPRTVGCARRWIAARLPGWAEKLCDDVLLLTSELVSNVVVHARTELVLGVAVTEHDILVGVHDLDLGRQEPPGEDRDGGRGLALVARLASGWGTVRHPAGGKTVWFRVSS